MSEDVNREADPENKGFCAASGDSGSDENQQENKEYVIDEYWDDKFGFQFGVLDWHSIGAGC